jgi:DNA-binding beta-propeller fold protein YncE
MAVLATAAPGAKHAGLPLTVVADVPLPGQATRFDYQDVDTQRGHLIVAHMGDSEVLVLDLADGGTLARIPNVQTVRGVVVASSANRIFATAMNGQVVAIDATTLKEVGRATTGAKPDGVGWDPADAIVATSDQGAGALSLIADAGTGARTPVPLGTETGNVIYDPPRGLFWVTVVRGAPPDQLVSVEPRTGKVKQRIELPGCGGAHGLRLHPDGRSALVACEDDNKLARVDLSSGALVTAPTGDGPDVLAIDPGLKWLYVAAEHGDTYVFDLAQEGLKDIGHVHAGEHAHSVAVDPATHRVFFPLLGGPSLRIMKPSNP